MVTQKYHAGRLVRLLAALACCWLLMPIQGCVQGVPPVSGPAGSASIHRHHLMDGTYASEAEIDGIIHPVVVTVRKQQITDITINSPPVAVTRKKCALCLAKEAIAYILETQSLQIDGVSGATPTSRAVVKAVKDALSASHSHPTLP